MARTYKRDARGRFSSTGASRSGRTGGGTLAARTSLRKSRAKLAGKDAADTSVGGTLSRRAQKGAVTRGEKRLKEVRKASTVKMQGLKRSGTIAKGGNGVRGSVARSLAAVKKGRQAAGGKPAGRAKPLRGVGAAVKGNLAGFKGLPVTIRTRSQAGAAYRARTNALGKSTAAKRGFAEAVSKRQSFADSAPRTVIQRKKVSQLTLSGRVERVGAGRFRTIGERGGGGRIVRPSQNRSPLPGSKARKRMIDRAIQNNGGKAVAAFYLG